MKKMLLVLGLAMMLAFTAGSAAASTVTFTDPFSSAVFDDGVAGQLKVTLTNTNTDVKVPVDVLTALFFSITGDPNLTSISAVLGAGSVVLHDSAPAGGVVGGEWAYLNGLSLSQFPGANQGISSTGLGIFGNPTFPGANLEGPNAVNGGQYGIVGGIAANANHAVQTEALIQNSVVFTLGGLPGGFTLADIANVGFQYGTSLAPPQVPEPGALLLLGSGLLGIAFYMRRRA